MLTGSQTAELLEQAKLGDNDAKEKLITFNAPLIKSVIKRYINKGIEYDDLFQLGSMGFVKAINNYDPNFNVKFTTYAVPMIAGEIKRFMRDDGSVKVSRSIKRNAIIIKNYIAEFVKQHGEQPSVEHLARTFNMDKTDLIFTMEANTNPLSLNEKFDDDEDGVCLSDKVADKFNVENYIDKLTLREMIEKLDKREKQVIIMRYYLDKTQSEIAKELGVSQVQVSRIENKVLQSMRDGMQLWFVHN